MFRTRPRGSLRAAALLAVGVSPLLAGVSAAAPAPSLDGLKGKVGDAPELNTTVTDQAGKIASGKTVKLPTPAALPQAPGALQQPAPQLPDAAHALPGAPALPVPAEAEERALPAAPALPAVNQLPVNQLPIGQLPSIDQLPVQLSQVGNLPIALPGQG
ncbi:MAG: hypothetical protein ABIQ18_30130 [Umezawaea sp.]